MFCSDYVTTVYVSTVVLLKGQTVGVALALCRRGFGSRSLHVRSHPLAPGDAWCCPAYVAVLDLFKALGEKPSAPTKRRARLILLQPSLLTTLQQTLPIACSTVPGWLLSWPRLFRDSDPAPSGASRKGVFAGCRPPISRLQEAGPRKGPYNWLKWPKIRL